MEPIVHKRLAGEGFALGQLVFVMREGQVEAAAVDVEGGTEVFHAHGGAFDVPAGAALAPGRIPGRLAGLGGLPQSEIRRVTLAGLLDGAGAGFLFFDAAVRELSVVGILGDFEVDIAIDDVGEIFVDESAADVDDVLDVIGGPGEFIDAVHAQSGQAIEVFLGVLLDQGFDGRVHAGRGVDELVLDVGDVDDPGGTSKPLYCR